MIIERNHDVKIDEKTFGDAATVGRFVNRNDSGYPVPTNADIPELDVLFVGEFDKEASPLAAKGLGELTAVSVAPTIANAVYHATGKKARDLPITVEKLL
jgi:xanthine dehydrogenase YagR molybdenum-binding subunit